MKRFKIKNNVTGNEFQVEREELGELQPEWGKPERWVLGEFLTLSQISEALEMRDTEETGPEYLMPAEFTIVEEDITDETNAQKLIQEGLQKQAVGAEVIAKVYAINETKELDADGFAALMSDPRLLLIERLLRNGALVTAKMQILTWGLEYFTEAEKAEIIQVIDSSGLVPL